MLHGSSCLQSSHSQSLHDQATSDNDATTSHFSRESGKVLEPAHLGDLSMYLPNELIDAALEATKTSERRARCLPSRVIVYFVVALALADTSSILAKYTKQAGNHGGTGHPKARMVGLIACEHRSCGVRADHFRRTNPNAGTAARPGTGPRPVKRAISEYQARATKPHGPTQPARLTIHVIHPKTRLMTEPAA